jgi:triosephosphate isomerase (TIM)
MYPLVAGHHLNFSKEKSYPVSPLWRINNMDRKLIIAGNWKMNKTASGTKDVLDELKSKVADITEIEIIVCPPFTSLNAAVSALRDSNIFVGAQNVHWEQNGAFTGEVSTEMLLEIPVEYVIIGHSERRQYFGETDQTVNRRLRAALDAGLNPIVCIGETLEQRQAGDTENVVSGQLEKSLEGLTGDEMRCTTIAYEPVWAIGTGVTAAPEQAQEVHALIRNRVNDRFGDEIGRYVRIQYGGSVKAGNSAQLLSKPDIDGALVGGASLDPNEFSALIRNAFRRE